MKSELSITTRSSLLERIKDLDDHESWREFATIYSDLIRRLALKARLSEDEAEDVVQEVLLSVARNIGGFTYDRKVSSFKRWLSNMTRWRIRDQWRKQHLPGLIPPPGEATPTDLLEEYPDPAASELQAREAAEWVRALIEKALARVKKRVRDRDYQIFFLSNLKEKPLADVCRQLGVSRAQVYLARHRVARLVKGELRGLRRREEG